MIEFKVLNKDCLKDYRDACKITEGIYEPKELNLSHTNEVEFWIKQICANHSL